MNRIAGIMGWMAFLALFTPATATPMQYGTGLANPALTIGFDGLAEGVAVGDAYLAQGVRFGGLYITSQFGNTLSPTTAPAAANFKAGVVNPVFSISFSGVMSDAAFFLVTDGFGATVTSSLGGTVVESTAVGSYMNNGADFFGFTDSAFDMITISVANTGSAVIDNVELGRLAAVEVPEPGSASVLLAGLLGVAGLLLRRRPGTAGTKAHGIVT